jgi:ribosomal protein S27E
MTDTETNSPTHIDAVNRLRLDSCPSCGIVFALPTELFSRRVASRENIFCPGCAHKIALAPGGLGSVDALVMNAQLVTDLRQRTHERDQFANLLAQMPPRPQGEITEEELLRRIRYVMNRAKIAEAVEGRGYGRLVCMFCEGLYRTRASLQAHLKRDHLDSLRTLAPEFFA